MFPVLFLFMMLCISGPAHALAPESHRVELFQRGVTTVPFEDNKGEITPTAAHSYRIPWLGDVDGVMVAIADARYVSSNDNSFIETAVKYSVDDGKTWETQIAIKNSRVSSVSRIVDPTVLVRGNKIYVLAGSYKIAKNYWTQQPDGKDWDIMLVVGEVKKSSVNCKVTANITWTKPVSLKSILPEKIAGSPSKQFLGGVSGAIVTTNGTFLIPVQVTNNAKKIYSTLIRSDDDGKNWAFVKGLAGPGFSEPAIVEWEGKLILSARYDRHYRMFYESTDMGERWTEALGTLSRVWGTSPKRDQPGSQSSFITVTIEGKRVMLFTHPLNFNGKWLRDRLHLWVTDNNRIFDVGQVSIGGENSAYSSLLYKNDKLYCLHEINTNEVYSLVFAELIGELRLLKSVVRTWLKEDKLLSDLCTPLDPGAVSPSGSCGDPFPTTGLVGFLSHNINDSLWQDVYRCVDASVSNAESVTNGLRFSGRGGGALWPVSKQGQNRRYQFANYRFTLVATVTINALPVDSSPLLGVSLDGSGKNKLLGLSYDKNRQWIPIYSSNTVSPKGSYELNKTYHVALTMTDKKGFVYIDGQALEGTGITVISGKNLPDISHFYIGGYHNNDMKAESFVTVTNVLLYNRQLEPSAIKTLFLSKDLIGTAGHLKNNTNNDENRIDVSSTDDDNDLSPVNFSNNILPSFFCSVSKSVSSVTFLGPKKENSKSLPFDDDKNDPGPFSESTTLTSDGRIYGVLALFLLLCFSLY